MRGVKKLRQIPKLPEWATEETGASRTVKVEEWTIWDLEFLDLCYVEYELAMDIKGTI